MMSRRFQKQTAAFEAKYFFQCKLMEQKWHRNNQRNPCIICGLGMHFYLLCASALTQIQKPCPEYEKLTHPGRKIYEIIANKNSYNSLLQPFSGCHFNTGTTIIFIALENDASKCHKQKKAYNGIPHQHQRLSVTPSCWLFPHCFWKCYWARKYVTSLQAKDAWKDWPQKLKVDTKMLCLLSNFLIQTKTNPALNSGATRYVFLWLGTYSWLGKNSTSFPLQLPEIEE